MLVTAALTETGASWDLIASQYRLFGEFQARQRLSLRDGILEWSSAVVTGTGAMVWGGAPNYFQPSRSPGWRLNITGKVSLWPPHEHTQWQPPAQTLRRFSLDAFLSLPKATCREEPWELPCHTEPVR